MKRIINISEELYNRINNPNDCEDLLRYIIKNSTPLTESEEYDCISRQKTLQMLARSIGKSNTYIQTQVLKMPSVHPKSDKLEKIRRVMNNPELYADDMILEIKEILNEANN